MTKETEQLYILLFRLGYHMRDVCAHADVGVQTPTRWKIHGLMPRPAVFNRLLAGMVDMGVKDGKLPEKSRGKTVGDVLEMGVL